MRLNKRRNNEFYLGGRWSNRGVCGLVRWFRSIFESSYTKPISVSYSASAELSDEGNLPGTHESDTRLSSGYKDIDAPDTTNVKRSNDAEKAGVNLAEQTEYIENKAFELILNDEGFKPEPYWDVTRWSIGHGLPANGRTRITVEESIEEVKQRIEQILKYYAEDYLFLHGELGPVRGVILVCMIYQLGRNGVKNFTQMNQEIRKQNWKAAAYEMYNSKWFWQTTKGIYNPGNRAQRFVRQMATGKE